MTYFAPYIDSQGLHTPLYQDIENYLTQQFQTIYGPDIYLANDSQDYQLIAALAKLCYDTLQGAQLAYNGHSPSTAVGSGLDSIVGVNGLIRASASYSIATVTLMGTPFAVINNGVVKDASGFSWNLPASVTLDGTGQANVTATCQTLGAITALPGQINTIQTTTQGWTSVTNSGPATPGQPVEVDSSLRDRQALSVANPSQALVTGILGSILAVTGVIGAAIYENDTNIAQSTISGAYNPGNFPPNSITCVINGGTGQTLANTIALRKTPGAYTNGDQIYTVTDQYGVPSTIRFYLPSPQTIDVYITIKALNGYTTAIGTNIINNVVNYINSLQLGQSIIISSLEQVALGANTTATSPFFSMQSLTAAIAGNALGTTDITMNFNQIPTATVSSVTLIVANLYDLLFYNPGNSQYIPLI